MYVMLAQRSALEQRGQNGAPGILGPPLLLTLIV
jgi:hypothetical protein